VLAQSRKMTWLVLCKSGGRAHALVVPVFGANDALGD
jgi:hypothetical protein